MTAVLATNNVSKYYEVDDNLIKAVDGVSLELHPGEFVALVGPSGSGKTSMLAMIAGLLSPTSGQIFLGGQEISDMNDRQLTRLRREKIGFTFQSNNLVPFLTVLENVELMLRLNSRMDQDSRRRAVELLERLGLGERLQNLPSQLSGGQKQRVAIDTTLAFQVVETFSELIHEQNRVGIMVTHDLRMVPYVDRVLKMVDGKLESIITDRREIEAMAGLRPAMPALAPEADTIRQNGHAEHVTDGVTTV
jgi:putative ABC transport system ATP-binding protein